MFARLSMIRERLIDSLWALPIAMVIVAAALAIVAVRLPISPRADPVWWLYSGGARAASAFLGNLLTAMITMATLAISITMVVLTVAAQSLGPRLIQIFMADTRTKLALGVFLGTVVYLLIALRTVVGSIDTVPNLAITIGTALILTSVVVLLFFVHHLARAIVADTIVERVGATLDAYADALLPEKTTPASDRPDDDIANAPNTGQPFTSDTTGYIQAIDHAALVSAAGNAGARVSLRFRQGQFVLSGDILGWVTPPEVLDEALSSNLAGAVVLGAERTPVQDLEYAIRQLVEIALRALSPGVNDPFTAAAVIDRATGSIAHIMKRASAQSAWCDDQGVSRLIIPATRFDGLLGATFHQVRQAGATQPAILIRLVDRLGQLLAHADANQAKAIVRHIELVGDAGQNGIPDEADRLALRDRVAKALDGTV